MRKSEIIILVVTVVAFVVAYLIYPVLPEKMASHWNAAGEVNGYMSRFWTVAMLPFMMAIFSLMFILIPRIDPLKKNIAQFRKYFDWFIFAITAFLVYVYALTILWNFGWRFNFAVVMTPALAALFYFSGVLMSKAKRNYFIGIRTPWTLSNDVVWDKTHRLAAKLFKWAAGFSLIGIFFGKLAIYFVLIPVVAAALISVVYSYVAYRQEVK
ncbi:MAG: SdpI family protein [Candidatus Paceibacterota bacterium]|jgi:uncharacterized membrane protein